MDIVVYWVCKVNEWLYLKKVIDQKIQCLEIICPDYEHMLNWKYWRNYKIYECEN